MPSAPTMARAYRLYGAHLAGERADALDKNLPGCAEVFRIEAERALRVELLLEAERMRRVELLEALDKPAPTV